MSRFIRCCCVMALLAATVTARAQEGDNVVPLAIPPAESGKYWIGVAVNPTDSGLVIMDVVSDSPAAKAGLKAGDTIVAVKDTPVKDYEQLARFVAESEGKAMELQISRDTGEQETQIREYAKGLLNHYDVNKDGSLAKDEWSNQRPVLQASDNNKDGVITLEELEHKLLSNVNLRRKMSVMVQPIKQTGGIVVAAPSEKKEGGSDDQGQKPGPQFRIEGGTISGAGPGSGGLRLQVAPGPQAATWQPIMAPGAPAQLPDDMEVKVTKKGNQPAVVKVSQGKKSWKTTEDELGMLPPQAQGYVSRLLGKGPVPGMPGAPGMPGRPGMMGMGAPGVAPTAQPKQFPGGGLQFEIREAEEKRPAADKPPQDPRAERAAEIERLRKQEEVLRKALEELRVRAREGQEKKD